MTYEDRPGLIGKIGTALGDAGVNIGSLNLGRRAVGGEAMVVLSIDSPADETVVENLGRAVEAQFVRQVHLES